MILPTARGVSGILKDVSGCRLQFSSLELRATIAIPDSGLSTIDGQCAMTCRHENELLIDWRCARLFLVSSLLTAARTGIANVIDGVCIAGTRRGYDAEMRQGS